MTFKKGEYKKWLKGLEKNKDFYERTCFEVAEKWADSMEKIINYGVYPKTAIIRNAKRLYSDIDKKYLTTGFQYGVIVGLLSQAWIYGDILRDWHNGKLDPPDSFDKKMLEIEDWMRFEYGDVSENGRF